MNQKPKFTFETTTGQVLATDSTKFDEALDVEKEIVLHGDKYKVVRLAEARYVIEKIPDEPKPETEKTTLFQRRPVQKEQPILTPESAHA